MRCVIIVSYLDNSSIKGVYGPYEDETRAKRAMARLKELPGMGEENWQVFPLHEVSIGSSSRAAEEVAP